MTASNEYSAPQQSVPNLGRNVGKVVLGELEVSGEGHIHQSPDLTQQVCCSALPLARVSAVVLQLF